MPRRSMAQGALRVSYPSSHTAGRPRPGADRGLPGEAPGSGPNQAVHTALLESLRDNGFAQVEQFQVTPKRARPQRGVGQAAEPAMLALDLEVAGDEDAVVLLEQDGAYSWHLPTSNEQDVRTRRLPAKYAPRTSTSSCPLRSRRARAACSVGWSPARCASSS